MRLKESQESIIKWCFASIGIVSLIALIFRIGKSAWNIVGVPAMVPRFVDLYTITEGNRCAAIMNLDPLISNPCDPYGRVMNYPRIWLKVAETVDNRPELLAAWILGLGLVGFLSFSYRSSSPNRRILYFGLSLLSPVALLGIERGNMDIAVLGICALGIKLATSTRDLGKAIGILLIFLAAILKLFPAALLLIAVILVISQKNRVIIKTASIIFLTFFVVVIFSTRSDISVILSGTPRPSTYGFGLGQSLELLRSQGFEMKHRLVYLVGSILFLLFFKFSKRYDGGKGLINLKLVKFRIPKEVARQQLLLATVLFSSTLLVASFPYRFIFAFLVVPPLIDLQNKHEKLPINKVINGLIALILSIPLLFGIQSEVWGLDSFRIMIAAHLTTPLCLVLAGMCFGLALTDQKAVCSKEKCIVPRAA